ncbi:amidohydrolase family protein [Roseomonas chloroacetimidivorans]|uniref:amidohydrolase family protein n=1 Tax=Roseomonas chloroacetimidivorans TaxID=1766656 RepID=UPI003C78CD02
MNPAASDYPSADCPGPDPAPRRPRIPLPPGTVDCHAHVFPAALRGRMVPERSYTTPPAEPEAYLAMLRTLGVARTVQVNASVYGADSTPTLELMKVLGPDRARGVVGLGSDPDRGELERLHQAGVRGARVSTHVQGYGGTDRLSAIAEAIAPVGWHLQIHLERSSELAELEALLLRLPVPLVFDHMGRVRGDEGVSAPGFQALRRLMLARDDVWAKVSSFYRLSAAGAPAYGDMRPIVEELVATRPDRLVWGTNWPHPIWHGPMPNDGDLVDLLMEWLPDPAVRRRIFAENPAALYGFDPWRE